VHVENILVRNIRLLRDVELCLHPITVPVGATIQAIGRSPTSPIASADEMIQLMT
jgi:hypothetical protein